MERVFLRNPFSALIAIFIASMLVTNMITAQITAAEVIKKSIEYHDPENTLANRKVTMQFIETRPSGPDRKSDVTIDLDKELYIINREVDNHHVSMQWRKDKSRFKLDHKRKLSAQQIEKYNLNEDRLHKMKDYYRYLWHLPMTLNDPGTIISKEVKTVIFNNEKSLEIKVHYDPAVGEDIWYFYFHPATMALVGYRFYHDESANDGEYIILSDEYKSGVLRLPKKRAWYMHKDDKYLGEDILSTVKMN